MGVGWMTTLKRWPRGRQRDGDLCLSPQSPAIWQPDRNLLSVSQGKDLEARVGIEPTHKGFADLSLTTWVPRPILKTAAGEAAGSTRFQLGQGYATLTAKASEIGAGDGT